jgi:hypothetical protein
MRIGVVYRHTYNFGPGSWNLIRPVSGRNTLGKVGCGTDAYNCRQAVRIHINVHTHTQLTTNVLSDIQSFHSSLPCNNPSSSSPYPPQQSQPSINSRALQTHTTPPPTNNTAPNAEATNMSFSPSILACSSSASVHGGRGW